MHVVNKLIVLFFIVSLVACSGPAKPPKKLYPEVNMVAVSANPSSAKKAQSSYSKPTVRQHASSHTAYSKNRSYSQTRSSLKNSYSQSTYKRQNNTPRQYASTRSFRPKPSHKQSIIRQLQALQKNRHNFGLEASQRLKNWEYLINDYRRKSELQKLHIANSYINQLRFVDDIKHWGRKDYWATPIETLMSNGGDCEDLAIAKYYTLNLLGMPEQCLSLSYVKVKDYPKPHMVLLYQCVEQDEPLVLDNLNPRVLSSRERRDLIPVYNFDAKNVWINQPSGERKNLSSSARLHLWNDLRRRVAKGI